MQIMIQGQNAQELKVKLFELAGLFGAPGVDGIPTPLISPATLANAVAAKAAAPAAAEAQTTTKATAKKAPPALANGKAGPATVSKSVTEPAPAAAESEADHVEQPRRDQMVSALQKVNVVKGTDEARKILLSFDRQKVTQVLETEYAAIIAACEKRLAQKD